MDLRAPESVDRVLAEFSPQAIIHTAALLQGREMQDVNAEGAGLVARGASRLGARLVHLSTDALLDGEHAPYSDSTPPSPVTPYGASKALAEQAVAEECPGALIVRTSLVYGFDPMDPRTRHTLNGEMPRLFTDEIRCPIFVDDLADALIELARAPLSGLLNVAGPQPLSRYEFGVRLAAAFRVPLRFAPARVASSPVPRPRDCTLDVSRARQLLRTRLRSVDEVVAQLPRALP